MKISQMRIVDQIMDYMKNLIADGVYKPGDKIPTEQELAESLGVGRSSVRESIKIFNYLGIMESCSARGTFIRERSNISSEALTWALLLGEDEQDEVVEMRGSIELWSFIRLTMLCKKHPEQTSETIKRIEDVIDTMREGMAEDNMKKMVMADFEFHRVIIEGADNALFVDIYQVLRSFMIDEIERALKTYTDRSLIVSEHEALLNAIKSGDVSVAIEVYMGHINNILTLLH